MFVVRNGSFVPTSIAIARYIFKFGTYWSTITSGELVVHLAAISGWSSPSLLGRSKYVGGFSVSGAHAAACADSACARAPLGGWFADAPGSSRCGSFIRQQELMA